LQYSDYNVAIKTGYNLTTGGFSNMTNQVFFGAFKEAAYMGIFVFIFSNLWGNKLGKEMAEKRVNPHVDNPYICRLMRQACTVAIMCPTMSILASVLFNIILAKAPWSQLPAIWIGTVFKNFPMAFLWNMYAAAPFTHWSFEIIFGKKQPHIQKQRPLNSEKQTVLTREQKIYTSKRQ
jgi:hypothetical protein